MRIEDLIKLAFDEDLGPGDLTTESTVDPSLKGTARIYAKQELIVSGTLPARLAFEHVGVGWEALAQDGDVLSYGENLCRLHGTMAGILQAERIALNFLMRCSGIATNTRASVSAAEGKVRVVCTRKTTPLHRTLEKQAVRHGGGHNHRHGLYDGVMIKDNHIVAAGGIAQAVSKARNHIHHLVKIEVEVENLEQLQVALDAGADVILLDNMDNETLAKAVSIGKGQAVLEASGNMTPGRIAELKDHGLDVISVGGLIHQARWVDFSLRIDPIT